MANGESKAVSLVFRIAALGLSVAAAVVMATASQLVIVHGDGNGNGGRGPPSSYDATVSYSHYSALRYFVAAGAISAVCSAAALYLCAVRRADAAVGSLPLVPLLDAAAQGLLFSAAGAAFAARGVLGGGAAAPWEWGYGGGYGGGGSVCSAAGAFCGKVTIAAVLGAGAAVAAAGAALTGDAARHRHGGSSSSSSSFCHS